jgi:ribonuclease D
MLLAEHRKLLADMKKLVQEKATELSVEPALLASKRELESLILTPPGESLPERFLGWRKDIITNGLMALKDDFS